MDEERQTRFFVVLDSVRLTLEYERAESPSHLCSQGWKDQITTPVGRPSLAVLSHVSDGVMECAGGKK